MGLLGIFSRHTVHNVTLYDSIFACKNILALVFFLLFFLFLQQNGAVITKEPQVIELWDLEDR